MSATFVSDFPGLLCPAAADVENVLQWLHSAQKTSQIGEQMSSPEQYLTKISIVVAVKGDLFCVAQPTANLVTASVN